MRITILTIFPDLIKRFLEFGIIEQAIRKGLIEANVVNPRDFTHDRHRSVDDAPFGGGGGMVMRPEPIFEAVEAHKRENERCILLSPQGTIFTHAKAAELAAQAGLIFICGRYEGIDERVRQNLVDEEISIGDYVTMGGELPALVVLESIARQLPDVLGNPESAPRDSFYEGLLDFPHYTRPAEYRNMRVPEILLSGNHKEIETWRRREAIKQTLLKRPDLLDNLSLSEDDRALIDELTRQAKNDTASTTRRNKK